MIRVTRDHLDCFEVMGARAAMSGGDGVSAGLEAVFAQLQCEVEQIELTPAEHDFIWRMSAKADQAQWISELFRVCSAVIMARLSGETEAQATGREPRHEAH